MLDILELIVNLFTEPEIALATIVLVPTLLFVLYWFGRRAGSRWPLNQPPDVVIQHIWRFTEDDLAYNRKSQISPAQYQRYRREVIWMVVLAVASVSFMAMLPVWLWSGSRRMVAFQVIFGVVMVTLTVAVFGWLIRRYVRDLRAKTVLVLITRWELEEQKGDFFMIPVSVGAYNLVVKHPNFKEPIKMRLGFLTPAASQHMAKLNGEMLLLYITSRTARPLACEIVRDPVRVAALERLQAQSKK